MILSGGGTPEGSSQAFGSGRCGQGILVGFVSADGHKCRVGTGSCRIRGRTGPGC